MTPLTKILSVITEMLRAQLQLLSMRALPYVQTSNTKKTVISSDDMKAGREILLARENPKRIGFVVYNNSTNSLYVSIDQGGAGSQIGQCGSNASSAAHFSMLQGVIYTGNIYGRRNSGSGSAWVVEFE